MRPLSLVGATPQITPGGLNGWVARHPRHALALFVVLVAVQLLTGWANPA